MAELSHCIGGFNRERNNQPAAMASHRPLSPISETHGAVACKARRSPAAKDHAVPARARHRVRLGLTDEGEAASDDAPATGGGCDEKPGRPFTEPRRAALQPLRPSTHAGFTREWFAHLVLMSFIIAFLGYTFYIGASVARRLHPPAPPPPPTRAKTVQQWLSDVVTLLFVY